MVCGKWRRNQGGAKGGGGKTCVQAMTSRALLRSVTSPSSPQYAMSTAYSWHTGLLPHPLHSRAQSRAQATTWVHSRKEGQHRPVTERLCLPSGR